MHHIWKLILIGSILLNLIAIWGFFHYIKYGGSPLGELKRKLTGSTKQVTPKIPYLDDNNRIIAKIADGEEDSIRIVFFGASITRRWDFEKYFPNINLVNRGVGGQLVPSMMARYKRDVIDLQPKAVIIKFCSINIRPHMPLSVLQDDMMMMVQLAQANQIIPIVSTIIPSGKPEATIGDFSVVGTLNQFNDWVRQYAAENTLDMIDFAKAIGDEKGFLPRDCSVDPVHVNDKGYLILTEAAQPVIDKVLGLK
ncbi:MAG: hypothetical protein GY839_04165 [candidate division Zixibacteria bacterium]|nr:hypothetical protein [candidate division Zixibacteria bacterium]